MKLIILLAVATLANAAKLDRNYLPPAHATTSGGSENFLQVPPVSGPNKQFRRDFVGNNRFTVHKNNGAYIMQNRNNNDHDFEQDNDDFAQNSNGFAPHGNNFAEQGNNFAHHDNNFAQHSNNFAQHSHGFENDDADFGGSNDINRSLERNVAILRQDNKNDGNYYAHSYKTENGIVAEESGVAANGVQAQGGFSYVGPDGLVYSVRYTADENGFQPQGDHLPTPPPIPEDILKALHQNAQDEANGIFDDGSYNPAKYENIESNHNSDYHGEKYNGGNNDNDRFNGDLFHQNNGFDVNSNDDDTIVTNNALLRSNNGFPQNNFGAEAGKMYLPPNRQNTFKKLPSHDQITNVRSIVNSFAPNTIDKGYLPPRRNIEFGQRAQINQYRHTFVKTENNKPENTYLGPFEDQNGVTGASIKQSTDRLDSRASNAPSRGIQRYQGQNGTQREYLPPARQHSNTRRTTRRVQYNY